MEEVMEPEDKYAVIRDALYRLGGRVRHDVLEGEVCGRKHRWRSEPVVLSKRSFKIYLKILILKGHILKDEVETPVGNNVYYELTSKISRRIEVHRYAVVAGILQAGYQLPPVLESLRKTAVSLMESYPHLVPELGEYGSKRYVTWMSTQWSSEARETLTQILARRYVLVAGEMIIPLKELNPGMRETLMID